MNRQLASLGLLLFAMAVNAQTTWNTTLNIGSSSPKFGLSTDHSLSFFTNNVPRMTLSNAGRLGIGTLTPIADLHVVGKALFTSDITTYGALNFPDNFKLQYTKAAAGNPNIFYTGTIPSGGSRYKRPCNVWYTNQEGTNVSYAWLPSTTNLYDDLLQIMTTTVSPQSVLNLGVLNNGDGILSIEPTPYAVTTDQKLKLNSGCSNDVYICEGGGKTKIFRDAIIVGDLDVNSRIRIGTAPFNLQSLFEVKTQTYSPKALYVWDPASTATDKGLFSVSNTGKTTIGTNIQTNNAMLKVGQASATLQALCLTNNASINNSDFFNVYGSGQTFIGPNLQQNTGAMFTVGQSSKTNVALSLTDNTSGTNKPFFNVYGNGYTLINVESPTGMPVPSYPNTTVTITDPRVFTIRDVGGNKDIFVVRADGKVYAREVEIRITDNFPDYVFDAHYDLKPISQVAEYIHENNHLPGFEKGEFYEKNGVNVNSLLLKQQEKLEEQMLYIIQLEKRLKLLETKQK